MDEYIRADNDFRQRREEAFRFSEMTRGFGGRFYPRHVRSIHNSTQNDDKGSQQQRPQGSSQASGQQQSSFRPPAPLAPLPLGAGFGATTKLLPAAGSKRQRRQGLRRKIWRSTKENILLVLW